MKRFAGCSFGPVHVRRVVRARCTSGEKLVGWAVVQLRDGLSSSVAIGLLGLVPGIGPLFALTNAAGHARVMVLTDGCLLILKADARPDALADRGVEHEIDLGVLGVRSTVEEHVFELFDGPERLGSYEILSSTEGAPARLKEALALLVARGDSTAV